MIKEEVTSMKQGIQKETRETKEAQRKDSEQTRERREMARVPDEGDNHGSERSNPHLHSPNILGQPAEESEREATRTVARAAEAHAAAEAEKVMQAWDTIVTKMARLDSPAMVSSAVAAAIQLTARVWNFEAPDAVEAVMLNLGGVTITADVLTTDAWQTSTGDGTMCHRGQPNEAPGARRDNGSNLERDQKGTHSTEGVVVVCNRGDREIQDIAGSHRSMADPLQKKRAM